MRNRLIPFVAAPFLMGANPDTQVSPQIQDATGTEDVWSSMERDPCMVFAIADQALKLIEASEKQLDSNGGNKVNQVWVDETHTWEASRKINKAPKGMVRDIRNIPRKTELNIETQTYSSTPKNSAEFDEITLNIGKNRSHTLVARLISPQQANLVIQIDARNGNLNAQVDFKNMSLLNGHEDCPSTQYAAGYPNSKDK